MAKLRNAKVTVSVPLVLFLGSGMLSTTLSKAVVILGGKHTHS